MNYPKLQAVERQMIIDTLMSTNGNIRAAARALGTTRWTISRRIARYGLDVHSIRSEALKASGSGVAATGHGPLSESLTE